MIHTLTRLVTVTAVLAGCCFTVAPQQAVAEQPLVWHDDYFTAYREAEQQHKQLFIFFRDEQDSEAADSYELTVLTDETLQKPLREMVLAVIPVDYSIHETQERLMDYEAFQHQQNRQGIAIVDLVESGSPLHSKVVSAHPFTRGRHLTAPSTKTVLELPRGTITQRSLIYAARINPYKPAGAQGEATPDLLNFSHKHCGTMCSWNSMHHSSFGGMEIVANNGESATIVDTAKSFIRMWQGSPPHWSILTGRHAKFGMDMKRAPSGHWYATGVFTN